MARHYEDPYDQYIYDRDVQYRATQDERNQSNGIDYSPRTSARSGGRNPTRGRGTSGRNPTRGRSGGIRGPAPFDRDDRRSGTYRADIEQGIEDTIAEIKARYSTGGGASARANAAVKEALSYLTDVKGNRAAIAEVYDEYDDVTGVFSEEAATSAEGLSEASEAMRAAEAADRTNLIEEVYDGANQAVADIAELIGAGQAAKAAAQADVTGKQFALDEAAAEAAEFAALIDMEEAMAGSQAIADRKRDEGQIDRRAEETDVKFKQQQEDAEERLAAARRAAAAAAAARRRAIAARNAAIEEARQSGQFDVKSAGQYSAATYMNEKGSHFRPDRAEHLEAKVWNAIENGVPADPRKISVWFKDQGLSRDEIRFVSGAVDAYEDGAAYEWGLQGGNNRREPSRY